MTDVARLAADLRARAEGKPRFMVAIAGPPGAGKTTLAADLAAALKAAGEAATVVPLDGFHFDDIVLNARGHRSRKGAPWTFDAAGFEAMLTRIRAREPEIAIPIFDRHMELSRNAAEVVSAGDRFIIAEGLYLLLKHEPWNRLKPLFDLTIFLDVPMPVVEERLFGRIRAHGHDADYARNWIVSNDIPNARIVLENSAAADLVVRN